MFSPAGPRYLRCALGTLAASCLSPTRRGASDATRCVLSIGEPHHPRTTEFNMESNAPLALASLRHIRLRQLPSVRQSPAHSPGTRLSRTWLDYGPSASPRPPIADDARHILPRPHARREPRSHYFRPTRLERLCHLPPVLRSMRPELQISGLSPAVHAAPCACAADGEDVTYVSRSTLGRENACRHRD